LPNLPAICNKCGQIFQSGFAVEGSGTIQITNCGSGPCPFCGAMGSIPDGIYSALAKTALLFTSGTVVKSQIELFVQTLKNSIHEKTKTDILSKKINEEHPELSSIADVLPKTRNELYLFLTFLVALTALLLNTCKSENSPPEVNQTDINVYVNQAIEEANKSIPKEQKLIAKNKINRVKTKNKLLKRKRNKIARSSRKKNRK